MHSLWLTEVDYDRRVNAVKGVRACLDAIGRGAQGHGLKAALAMVQECHHSKVPVLMGRHIERSVLEVAMDSLRTYSAGACEADFDLSPEDVFAGGKPDLAPVEDEAVGREDEDTDDEVYEPEVYETVMVLLVSSEGSPAQALAVANTLMRTTSDPELWDAVGDLILKVFPPSNPNVVVVG